MYGIARCQRRKIEPFSLFPRFGPVPMVDTDVMVRARLPPEKLHNGDYRTSRNRLTQAPARSEVRASRKIENADSRIDVEQFRMPDEFAVSVTVFCGCGNCASWSANRIFRSS
jgi:hypothetical protein